MSDNEAWFGFVTFVMALALIVIAWALIQGDWIFAAIVFVVAMFWLLAALTAGRRPPPVDPSDIDHPGFS